MADLDLRGAKDVNPETSGSTAPISDLPPLAGAGVNLVKWVLSIASAFIVLMFLYLLYGDIFLYQMNIDSFTTLTKSSDSTGTVLIDTSRVLSLMEKVDSQRKDFHEFWFKVIQIILLNVWLPILTALLGYIFATRQNESR
jgi:hypothetical protein